MTERRRWGKAGVPLTDAEARRNDHQRALSQHTRVAYEQENRRRFDAGLLVPYRITLALDANGLYGPEVDEACGAAEPDVDHWEAGELYPTWEQLQLLSNLTGYAVRAFFIPAPEKPVWTTLDYHLPSTDPAEPPVREFKPGAREASPTPIQGVLDLGGGVRS